jgi:hypothetical protein
MNSRLSHRGLSIALFSTFTAVLLITALPAGAQDEEGKKKVYFVPRGEYVRQLISEEAVINVGYRTANESVGKNWMLLELGLAVLPGHNQNISRDAFTLETPDGSKIRLATQAEVNKDTAALRALNARADIQREPVSYFPVQAQIACWIGFFADPARSELPFDTFGIVPDQGCVGRLFFQVPEGITYGRYLLHVKLASSELAVPLHVMTKEELKKAKKEYKEFEKEQKRKAKEEAKKAKEKK